jgi:hypothetical protein
LLLVVCIVSGLRSTSRSSSSSSTSTSTPSRCCSRLDPSRVR